MAALAFVAALALGACTADPTGPASPTAAGEAGPSPLPNGVPAELANLAQADVEIGDLELRVAIADTPPVRSRGLMGIDDLGPLDGMLFVFGAPSQSGFYMRNVPAPLDIAFIGADGAVLAVLTMATCPDGQCPTYRSPAPFQWALETPAEGLASVEPGDRFAFR